MRSWCKRLLWLSIIVIFIGSVAPYGSGAPAKSIFSVGLDKILHYLSFGWLVILSFGAKEALHLKTGMISVFFTLSFGILVELVQYPIPYRTFNPADIFANICGVISGSVLWLIGSLWPSIRARVATRR